MLRRPERKKAPGPALSHASEDPTLSTSLDDDGKETCAVQESGEEPRAVWVPGVEPQAVQVQGSKQCPPSVSSDGDDISHYRRARL